MALLKVSTTDADALRRQLRDARRDIDAALREESRRFAPALVRSAQAHASGEVEKRVAQSAAAKITGDGFIVSFGRTGKLSGGAKLSEVTRPYEFGTNRRNEKVEYLTRSRRGKAYRAKRRTRRQLPPHNAKGRFLYPALADVTPQLVTGYVRAITNTITDY